MAQIFGCKNRDTFVDALDILNPQEMEEFKLMACSFPFPKMFQMAFDLKKVYAIVNAIYFYYAGHVISAQFEYQFI